MTTHVRPRRRLSGVTHRRLVLASTLLISMPIIVMAAPPNSITSEEMALIPRYCAYAQSFADHVRPEAKQWAARMGEEGFHAIHHYCWGQINLMRAMRAGMSRQERDHLLSTIVSDYDFVINHAAIAQKNFVLLPEILTGKGEVQLLLSRPNDANKSFAQARVLKPDYWPAYSGWAEFLIRAGKTTEAKIIVKSGLEFSPNSRTLRELYRLLGGDPSTIVPKAKPSGPESSGASRGLPAPADEIFPAEDATELPPGGSVAQ